MIVARLYLLFVAIVAMLAAGCVTAPISSRGEAQAHLSPATKVTRDLFQLPPPKGKIVVAVYGFRDQTGQYKPSPERLVFHGRHAGRRGDPDQGAAGLGLVHSGGAREPAEPAHRTQDRARARVAAGKGRTGAPGTAAAAGVDHHGRQRYGVRQQYPYRWPGCGLSWYQSVDPVPRRPGYRQPAQRRYPHRQDTGVGVDDQIDPVVRGAPERFQIRQLQGPGAVRGGRHPQRAGRTCACARPSNLLSCF